MERHTTRRTHKAKKRATRKPKEDFFSSKLEIYAFWTGFASTIISLLGVLVQAFRA